MSQPELPNDWQLKRLGDIVNVKGGKRLPKGASFASAVTQHPYLRIVDFANGQVRIGDLRYLSDEVHEAIKQYTINKNDVYLSIAGTIGSAGVIPDELDGANLTENAAKLVLKTAKCSRLPRPIPG